MVRVLLIGLILVFNLTLLAQQRGIEPDSPAFNQKYAGFDFKEKFASSIDKDETNTYFLLDFTKFGSRFERVYFMNLSFSSDILVNIDANINKTRVCFKADKSKNEVEVLQLFDKLKLEVADTAAFWSEEKKSEWMKANDKYK